jgi:hypothetical protein
MPVICSLRNTDINSRIKAQIFIRLIRKPSVKRAYPMRILFGANAAEEFSMIGNLTENNVANAD